MSFFEVPVAELSLPTDQFNAIRKGEQVSLTIPKQGEPLLLIGREVKLAEQGKDGPTGQFHSMTVDGLDRSGTEVAVRLRPYTPLTAPKQGWC